ncbi:uncharacterized protein IL334_002817 [Kwoniella shivajii]|uniref:Integrase zinc-binding domain-containing protein n=1 Tax=Kwoniella shivajii TaxID=564305 RepID=A0ABZ1CW57_9TREE|nr:hypothetical protein IL334_002817 [Kwoniella shivajii]
MPAIMSRPPPGHPAHSHSYDEYETLSRSSSNSPPDADELWCDPDDLLAVPIYDPTIESNADPLFPSPHKFNLMVQDYLRNLSPKKREKALLTQKMYDAVLSVLQDPKDTSTKTAQFRFWAKKMFQLTSFGGEKVVCHDHKPVAVKEQIYEVLCHCHGQAGHGGRDKTSAQVRRYYSWIPKEIIARFVRDCPFCQSRRTQSSAGFSNMSESQAFLISLQTSDTQLASKRPVSLAQARANAAALGHKPHRRPSIRTIDSCRSRRGSAVSDDGYIHYTDGSTSMNMEMSSSYEDGQDSLYVPSTYEFPGMSSNQEQDQNQNPIERQNQNQIQGLFNGAPPMPRRASSYHEQLLLDVKPISSESMSMIRRNSESNINNSQHLQSQYHSNGSLIYSNPPSTNPDFLGGNQFLSVPGMGGLSRTTSSSSLNSLNDDNLSDLGYFTQHLQLDPSLSSDGSAIDTGMNLGIGIDSKNDEWRENNIYPISGSTTPLEGNFNFPLTNLPGMEINFFSTSTEYSHGNSLSVPPSTYILPVPDFPFPEYQNSTTDEPYQISDQQQQWNTNTSVSQQHAEDQSTLDAVAAVQRMFDSNNIFALGEVAGMTENEVMDLHNVDPAMGMLNLDDLRNQLGVSLDFNNDNKNITTVIVNEPDKSDEINAELEAISILALSTQDTDSDNSGILNHQFEISEESCRQMEIALAQAVEEVRQNSRPVPAVPIPISAPTVIIQQPSDSNIFLFTTSLANQSYPPPVLVEEPKSEFNQDLDFSNWAVTEFAMS